MIPQYFFGVRLATLERNLKPFHFKSAACLRFAGSSYSMRCWLDGVCRGSLYKGTYTSAHLGLSMRLYICRRRWLSWLVWEVRLHCCDDLRRGWVRAVLFDRVDPCLLNYLQEAANDESLCRFLGSPVSARPTEDAGRSVFHCGRL